VIGDFMQAVHRDLVPTGTLRAAINFGNALVAHHEGAGGESRGLAIDLVNELARRLSVPRSILEFEGVAAILEAGMDIWDLAFLAIDPVHSQRFDFTPAYVVFEGTYVVRDDSPNRTVLELDREGVRIGVSQDATYDRYLTRTLRHA
jgi:polar amino acid transport system substrate-binding protein